VDATGPRTRCAGWSRPGRYQSDYHMPGAGDLHFVGLSGLDHRYETRQVRLGLVHVDLHDLTFVYLAKLRFPMT
jgi:hypothetical protein